MERYEKRDPAKRAAVKRKKQTPQEAWMELLTDSVAEAPVHLRHYLSEISTRDNVPRKEKQFRNFIANSMRISQSTVEQIWNYLKELKEKQQAAKDAQKKAEEEGSQFTKKQQSETTGKKEGAEPISTSDEHTTNHKPANEASGLSLPSADEVKKAMKKILKKETDKKMPLKKLRKAVCAKYGIEKNGKKHMKKLLEKHLSGKKFVLDNNVVRLKID